MNRPVDDPPVGRPNWRAVVSEQRLAGPAEVDWPAGTDLGATDPLTPPVGRVSEQAEFWWRTRTSAESLTIDRISFPAEVFVDGELVAESVSEFLPLRVELPGSDCEVVIVCRSLARWLGTRRPRGRWRSALTADQGLRWARVSLVGRVPAFAGPAPLVGARGLRLGAPPVLTDLRVGTRVAGETGILTVTAMTRCPGDYTISLTGPDGAVRRSTVTAGTELTGSVEITRPRLWWPAGYGDPDCYTLGIALDGGNLVRRVVGFRTVEVDRSGDGFSLLVNDLPVFCRGCGADRAGPGWRRGDRLAGRCRGDHGPLRRRHRARHR